SERHSKPDSEQRAPLGSARRLGLASGLALCLITALGVVGRAQSEYVVGAHDVLSVTVFSQPELTGKFEVGADGSLTFPLITRVKVAGLTTRGIEQALFTKLSPA